MMLLYVTAGTEEPMPLPISLAHRLAGRPAVVRMDGTRHHLRPGAKSQVTVRNREDRPVPADPYPPDRMAESLTA